MGTKRLLRLVALVALLGGVSIYYTTQVVPMQVATSTSEMIVVSAPVDMAAEVANDTGEESMPTSAPQTTPVNQTATAASSLDADIAAIETMVDGTYDDSALEASITSDGSAVLDQAYEF